MNVLLRSAPGSMSQTGTNYRARRASYSEAIEAVRGRVMVKSGRVGGGAKSSVEAGAGEMIGRKEAQGAQKRGS